MQNKARLLLQVYPQAGNGIRTICADIYHVVFVDPHLESFVFQSISDSQYGRFGVPLVAHEHVAVAAAVLIAVVVKRFVVSCQNT